MNRPSKLKTLAAALAVMSAVAAPAHSAEGDRADDATLTARVKAALGRDANVTARTINVETKDGIVQLSGFVPSDKMQTQALHTARAVEGVAEVRNDITVRGTERSADQAVDDSVIEARVKSTLNDASVGEKGDVNVEVNNGVVQLSGFVANLEVKNRAADAASTVEGVRDVRNNIALSR